MTVSDISPNGIQTAGTIIGHGQDIGGETGTLYSGIQAVLSGDRALYAALHVVQTVRDGGEGIRESLSLFDSVISRTGFIPAGRRFLFEDALDRTPVRALFADDLVKRFASLLESGLHIQDADLVFAMRRALLFASVAAAQAAKCDSARRELYSVCIAMMYRHLLYSFRKHRNYRNRDFSVSDLYLSVIRGIAAFRPDKSPEAENYLAVVIRNAAAGKARKQDRELSLEEPDRIPDVEIEPVITDTDRCRALRMLARLLSNRVLHPVDRVIWRMAAGIQTPEKALQTLLFLQDAEPGEWAAGKPGVSWNSGLLRQRKRRLLKMLHAALFVEQPCLPRILATYHDHDQKTLSPYYPLQAHGTGPACDYEHLFRDRKTIWSVYSLRALRSLPRVGVFMKRQIPKKVYDGIVLLFYKEEKGGFTLVSLLRAYREGTVPYRETARRIGLDSDRIYSMRQISGRATGDEY